MLFKPRILGAFWLFGFLAMTQNSWAVSWNCPRLLLGLHDYSIDERPLPTYFPIEVGGTGYQLLKISDRVKRDQLSPVLLNADGTPTTILNACNGEITAVVSPAGELVFFRNRDGKKLVAQIPPELTAEGRVQYISRSLGVVPAGASSAITGVAIEGRRIIVEDSMVQYRFMYNPATQAVDEIRE